MGTVDTVLRYAPHFVKFALRKITFNQEKKTLDIKQVRRNAYEIIRQHCFEMLKAAKTTVVTSGRENIPLERPVLFISNHQSIFDVVVHLTEMDRPTIFVAKKELSTWPLYSRWMIDMGILFLDRDDPRAAVQVINEAARRMREEDVDGVIYPEGTRSKTGELLDFQKGSFKLAEKAGCPIVPVMIEGAYHMLEEDRKLKNNQTVYMKFLEPVYLDKLTKEEEKVIHKTVKSRIEQEVHQVREAIKAGKDPFATA